MLLALSLADGWIGRTTVLRFKAGSAEKVENIFLEVDLLRRTWFLPSTLINILNFCTIQNEINPVIEISNC